MTKFCVVWRTQTAMVNFSYLLLELYAVGACLVWAGFQTNRHTEQIYTVVTFKGKIEIQFFQGVVPAVTVVIAKTIYCFIATEAWK